MSSKDQNSEGSSSQSKPEPKPIGFHLAKIHKLVQEIGELNLEDASRIISGFSAPNMTEEQLNKLQNLEKEAIAESCESTRQVQDIFLEKLKEYQDNETENQKFIKGQLHFIKRYKNGFEDAVEENKKLQRELEVSQMLDDLEKVLAEKTV